MFTAPTAMRALERADPDGREGKEWDIGSLEFMYIAGEHCEHETRLWSSNRSA